MFNSFLEILLLAAFDFLALEEAFELYVSAKDKSAPCRI